MRHTANEPFRRLPRDCCVSVACTGHHPRPPISCGVQAKAMLSAFDQPSQFVDSPRQLRPIRPPGAPSLELKACPLSSGNHGGQTPRRKYQGKSPSPSRILIITIIIIIPSPKSHSIQLYGLYIHLHYQSLFQPPTLEPINRELTPRSHAHKGLQAPFTSHMGDKV